jgi:hypothetical protein
MSVQDENQRLAEGTRPLSTAGLIRTYLGALAYIAIVILLLAPIAMRSYGYPDNIYAYLPELILFVVGTTSAIMGINLIRSAGLAAIAPNVVINPKEWSELSSSIKEGKEDAVTQYIRLTSLTGLTGLFTKLGLTGLPLATIFLTMFFSLLYLKDEQYLDLAKLTLGAFIGSFVQKQISAPQAGGTVQLPTGEKLTVSSPPSYPPA